MLEKTCKCADVIYKYRLYLYKYNLYLYKHKLCFYKYKLYKSAKTKNRILKKQDVRF